MLIENPAEFMNEFAVSAVWSVGPATVDVLFFSGYEAAELGAIAGMEGVRFTAVVATADVPTAAHGQTLTVNGTAYVIRGVQQDDTGANGMTTLLLQEP